MLLNPYRFLVAASPETIEFVGGKSAATTTVALNSLTGGIASTPSAGDLILVFQALRMTGAASYTQLEMSSAGYSKLEQAYANDSNDTMLAVFAKISDGTETSAVATTQSAGSTTMGAAVFRGVEAEWPLDVASTVAEITNTGQPDPPAITPSTSGAAVVVVGSSSINNALSDPGGLSDFFTSSGSAGQGAIAHGWTPWTTGALNIGSFGGSTSTFEAAAAITMALRPEQNDGAVIYGQVSGVEAAIFTTTKYVTVSGIEAAIFVRPQ